MLMQCSKNQKLTALSQYLKKRVAFRTVVTSRKLRYPPAVSGVRYRKKVGFLESPLSRNPSSLI